MKQPICIATVCLLLFFSSALYAQERNHKTIIHAGIEIDALPYVTGGYFGAAWVSKDHWRARLLTADVNMPGFITKKGFRNHHKRMEGRRRFGILEKPYTNRSTTCNSTFEELFTQW